MRKNIPNPPSFKKNGGIAKSALILTTHGFCKKTNKTPKKEIEKNILLKRGQNKSKQTEMNTSSKPSK